MLSILRHLIGEDIELAWRPGADLGRVLLDPVQVDQILTNLCVNARDAIGGVGRITIETANVAIDEAYSRLHPGLVAGDYVMLAVSDDGCGMDEATMSRAFEPFFTTKGVGEGTGLGLATVYGIVKQNGGFVDLYSEREAGTTLKIYLPRLATTELDVVLPGVAVDDDAEAAGQGGETLLVAEDDPAILAVVTEMRARFGYEVLAAEGPERALTLAAEHVGEIALLITDVVMPGMNGGTLAQRLQADHPALKVLFMSGYTADVIADRGVLEAGVHFVQKPFTTRILATKVRAALAGS